MDKKTFEGAIVRERKFRGRAVNDYPSLKIKRGDWVFGYLADEDTISVKTYMDDYGDLNCVLVQVDPRTVGQYVNLKDGNGREIYEDDVVRDQNGNLYQVKFIVYYIYPFNIIFPNKSEVVGNIHDNVEMLGMQNV